MSSDKRKQASCVKHDLTHLTDIPLLYPTLRVHTLPYSLRTYSRYPALATYFKRFKLLPAAITLPYSFLYALRHVTFHSLFICQTPKYISRCRSNAPSPMPNKRDCGEVAITISNRYLTKSLDTSHLGHTGVYHEITSCNRILICTHESRAFAIWKHAMHAVQQLL